MAFPEYISDTQIEDEPVYLTTLPEIERKLSHAGVDLATLDINEYEGNEQYDPDNVADVTFNNYLTEIIQYATSEVMSYLIPRYSLEAVIQNPRLREIATYFAIERLTNRKGNEPIYATECAEGRDLLQDYREGIRFLDAPTNGPRAVMQSSIVDLRFHHRPIRILPTNSSHVYPGQHNAYVPFGWI